MRTLLVSLLLGACTANAYAQESEITPQPDDQNEEVVNLDTVRVTAPKLETLDLYRFRNPIDAKATRFERGYRGEYSLEQLGKDGGLITVVPAYLLGKVAEGVQKLPGYKHQIQPATARPPPLTEAQARRVVQASESTSDTTP